MSSTDKPVYRIDTIEGVSVITLPGPQFTGDARDELYALIPRLGGTGTGPKRVMLNLANVRQIHSAAIAVLINFQKRVREAGGALKICQIDPHVYQVFLLTKMDQVLDLHKTQQEAIDAFHGRGGSRGKTGGSAGHGTDAGGGFFKRMFGSK